jgi:CRISPR-associated protein (TIGR03984 family)
MNTEFCDLKNELCKVTEESITKDSLDNWLKQQAKDYKLSYLLAHAEDGVIWGRFDIEAGTMETADKVFPLCKFSILRLSTLQQCRIFGDNGEVLLWNSNEKWRSRLILQSKVSELENKQELSLIQEEQVLWGTKGQQKGNFTLLSDGSQGLKHAVPVTGIKFANDGNKRPVRLTVAHYFACDSDGVARIFISRLVSLSLK